MNAVQPLAHVDSAAWIAQSLASSHDRVSGLVPAGFDAYIRILHRATGPDGTPMRWGQVARAQGRQVHASAQFPQVAGRVVYDPASNLGWLGENPTRGSLDADSLRDLCGVLGQFSLPTTECSLLLWEGWGNLPTRWALSPHRAVQGSRAYYLFSSQLNVVPLMSVYFALPRPVLEVVADDQMPTEMPPRWTLPNVQSPNQWWPADRTWFVATEVDYDSTIVGGPQSLISEISAHPALESSPVSLSNHLGADSDRTNPPLASRL